MEKAEKALLSEAFHTVNTILYGPLPSKLLSAVTLTAGTEETPLAIAYRLNSADEMGEGLSWLRDLADVMLLQLGLALLRLFRGYLRTRYLWGRLAFTFVRLGPNGGKTPGQVSVLDDAIDMQVLQVVGHLAPELAYRQHGILTPRPLGAFFLTLPPLTRMGSWISAMTTACEERVKATSKSFHRNEAGNGGIGSSGNGRPAQDLARTVREALASAQFIPGEAPGNSASGVSSQPATGASSPPAALAVGRWMFRGGNRNNTNNSNNSNRGGGGTRSGGRPRRR